ACDCCCNGWSRGGRKRGLLLLLARAAVAIVAGGEEWMAATTGEESRATTRDVQLLRQRRRKRIVVYSNLLSVAAEGYDQQRWHSDARAKRHCERDRGSGTAKEEVAAKDHKGEEVAVMQWRKAISGSCCQSQQRKIALWQSVLIPC
ncbi:hypothetical protein B296_00058400, partial [Ensete ventricosum]